jgi:hypothetical protein
VTNGCDFNACIEPATHYHEDGEEKGLIFYSCDKHACVNGCLPIVS